LNFSVAHWVSVDVLSFRVRWKDVAMFLRLTTGRQKSIIAKLHWKILSPSLAPNLPIVKNEQKYFSS
jgi:hypothetical protein